MSNTALGAKKAIIFISDAHEKFYYEKLKEVRYGRIKKESIMLKITSAGLWKVILSGKGLPALVHAFSQ